MEITLPIRPLHPPPPPPPRSLGDIISSLLHLFVRRSADHIHFATFSDAHSVAPSAPRTLTPWHPDSFSYPCYYLKKALTFPGDPIPLALRTEIREGLLAMEAEAKVLGGDIEFNFWRKYFQTGREREERDLARERDECLRGWLRLLQAWENACRRYYVPVNETTAADITAWMADLCLGRG